MTSVNTKLTERSVLKLDTQSRYLQIIFRQAGTNLNNCEMGSDISGQGYIVEVQLHQDPQKCGLSQKR